MGFHGIHIMGFRGIHIMGFLSFTQGAVAMAHRAPRIQGVGIC